MRVVVGCGGELLLFEKRVSGLHNSASTEMKQRQRKGRRKRQRHRESESWESEKGGGRKKRRRGEKNSCAALTDDLTGETEFVFCREMSDALPGRGRERDGDGEGEQKQRH